MTASPAAQLPLHLDVTGRQVLVVGGGPVALRKIRSCLECGADVKVVALEPCAAVAALAVDHRVRLRQRAFVESDLDGCWLAFTACGTEVDADVAAAAEARRVFCVRADSGRDAAGSLSPAVLRQGTLTISVSTGRPRQAMELRDRIGLALIAGELGMEQANAAAPAK